MKKPIVKNFLALAPAIGFVSALDVYADNQNSEVEKKSDNDVEVLEKVTISSTLTPRAVGEVANSVSIISSDDVEKNLSRNIRDLIRYEPGVEVGSAGRFGLSGFSIRGLSGNRVKIIVDGVEQSKDFSPGGDFLRGTRNFFEIDSLQTVEIVKGPVSALYGSDALGGIIAFRTQDPIDYLDDDDTFGGNVRISYNQNDSSWSERLALANRFGDFESLLLYTRRDGNESLNYNDGYTGGPGNDRTKKDPVEFSSDNLLGKLYYQANDQHRIGLSFNYYKSDTQTELLSLERAIPFGPDFIPVYTDYTGDDVRKRYTFIISHDWKSDIALFDRVKSQIDYQDSTSDQDTRNTFLPLYGPRLIDYSNEESQLGMSSTLFKTFSNDSKLTYGISYKNTQHENRSDKYFLDGSRPPDLARYTPTLDNDRFGIFSQYEFYIIPDKLSAIAGLRYDQYKASTKADSRFATRLKSHSSDKVTGRFGLVYQFNETYSAFTQYSQGFKSPDAIDLYHEFEGRGYLLRANPDLKPETSDNIEIGLRANQLYSEIEIAAFYSRFDDFIKDTTDYSDRENYPGGILSSDNISEAKINGIEIKAGFELDHLIGAPEGTTLKLGYAYTDGEGRNTGEEFEPLTTINPSKLVLGLEYNPYPDLFGTALNITNVQAKKRDDLPEGSTLTKTPSFTTFDVTAYYNIGNNWTTRVGIFNITDKEYWLWQDVNGTDRDNTTFVDRSSSPGRHVALSLSCDL